MTISFVVVQEYEVGRIIISEIKAGVKEVFLPPLGVPPDGRYWFGISGGRLLEERGRREKKKVIIKSGYKSWQG